MVEVVAGSLASQNVGRVFLDGVETTHVVAFNDDEGWIDQIHITGNRAEGMGDLRTRRLTGVVTFTRHVTDEK